MQFHFEHIAGLDSKEVAKTAERLKSYLEHIKKIRKTHEYEGKESVVNLAEDSTIADETCELAKKLGNENLKFIFVIGIGGANLGTAAIYEALTGRYDIATHVYPKIIFIDTVSSFLHMNVDEIVNEHIGQAEEFVINVISKSGGTTETLANFDVLYKMLSKKCTQVHTRVVVTTKKGSALWKGANKQGFHCVDHRNVAGRYSVMSAVGQLPLRLAGFDVDTMLKGAEEMVSIALHKDFKKNPALTSAVCIYLNAMHGKGIHNGFYFNPELESLGKWYRQLMAESLGKNHEAGITPTVSIGSTDLHSMVQLYFAGPHNTFTNFVYAPEDDPFVVDNASGLMELLPHLEGRKLGEIMAAIYKAVTASYRQKKLPFMETLLPDVSEYTLGQYMQWKMIEMMFLAHLFNVDAFNQPHVEDYKKMIKL